VYPFESWQIRFGDSSLSNGTNRRANTDSCCSTRPAAVAAPIAKGKRGNDEIAFFFSHDDKDSGAHTMFVYRKSNRLLKLAYR
jgi:hypothetical protein